MTTLEIIEQIWRNTWKCWACAENVRRITAGRKKDAILALEQATPNTQAETDADRERTAWGELLVRARWAARFLILEMKPKIAETYRLAGGNPDTLPDWTPIRARVPVSFTEAPPPEVVALEASFSPNDEVLRQVTVPYTDQHNHLYTALITASYQAAGMGITLDKEFQALSPPQEVLLFWNRFIRQGLAYLSWGRGCFADSEVALNRITNSYQGAFAESQETIILNKYLADNDTIKAVGGLYTLNVELLPPEWAAKVEPDPVVFSGL